MSLHHRIYCRSEKWSRKLRDEVLPWTLEGVHLGTDVLEVGPGAGYSTEILLGGIGTATVLDIDLRNVRALRSRLKHGNVGVVAGSAARMPFSSQIFTAVVSVMVLHHISPAPSQERAVREAYRVLRPGGVFVGVEGIPAGYSWRIAHLGDAVTAVDKRDLAVRLTTAGFVNVRVDARRQKFRFLGYRPGSQ